IRDFHVTGVQTCALPISRYERVLVDEAQDNTLVQLRIAQRLAERGRLFLYGDLRQAIFGWNGGYPAIFRDADERLGAMTLSLPKIGRASCRERGEVSGGA